MAIVSVKILGRDHPKAEKNIEIFSKNYLQDTLVFMPGNFRFITSKTISQNSFLIRV